MLYDTNTIYYKTGSLRYLRNRGFVGGLQLWLMIRFFQKTRPPKHLQHGFGPDDMLITRTGEFFVVDLEKELQNALACHFSMHDVAFFGKKPVITRQTIRSWIKQGEKVGMFSTWYEERHGKYMLKVRLNRKSHLFRQCDDLIHSRRLTVKINITGIKTMDELLTFIHGHEVRHSIDKCRRSIKQRKYQETKHGGGPRPMRKRADRILDDQLNEGLGEISTYGMRSGKGTNKKHADSILTLGDYENYLQGYENLRNITTLISDRNVGIEELPYRPYDSISSGKIARLLGFKSPSKGHHELTKIEALGLFRVNRTGYSTKDYRGYPRAVGNVRTIAARIRGGRSQCERFRLYFIDQGIMSDRQGYFYSPQKEALMYQFPNYLQYYPERFSCSVSEFSLHKDLTS